MTRFYSGFFTRKTNLAQIFLRPQNINKKVHPKITLPAVNPLENLETISRNKLSLLLDPALFEIREELQRDKGIDLVVELKQDNSYTNFRFAVQLKSSNSTIPNTDKSLSFPVDVTNINYLMNYGLPSYYIFYDHQTSTFYIEPVHKVFQSLLQKYQPEKLPHQFSVRFTEVLTPESIAKIYTATLENGMMLRNLNVHLSLASNSTSQTTGILIDNDNQVYSVEQNIAFIDYYGFQLLNRHEYGRIIEIEQRTHPRAAVSGTFNFVCGMAYFQHANVLKAFEFLKAAQLGSADFDFHKKSMLAYTFLQAKYMLGMIGDVEYRKEITDLMESEDLCSYLRVEKAYTSFFEDSDTLEARTEVLQKELLQLIVEQPDISGLRIRCYSILLEIEGKSLLQSLHHNAVLLCGRVEDLFLTTTFKQWKQLDVKHVARLMSLLKYSMENQSFLAVGNIACEISAWEYQKIYIFHTLRNWDQQSMSIKGTVSEENIRSLEKLADKLIGVIDGYKTLENKENMFYALAHRFELLHLAGKLDEANAVATEMQSIIDKHDLNGLKRNLQNLLKGDLRHTQFMTMFTAKIRDIYRVAENSGINYFRRPMSEKEAKWIESDIEWPKHLFFELYFPPR